MTYDLHRLLTSADHPACVPTDTLTMLVDAYLDADMPWEAEAMRWCLTEGKWPDGDGWWWWMIDSVYDCCPIIDASTLPKWLRESNKMMTKMSIWRSANTRSAFLAALATRFRELAAEGIDPRTGERLEVESEVMEVTP